MLLTLFIIYGGSLFIPRLNQNFKLRSFFGITIYLISFTAGYVISSVQNIEEDVDYSNSLIIGEILGSPELKEKTVKTTIKIQGIKLKTGWKSADEKAVLFIEKNKTSTALQAGNYIAINPTLKEIPPPSNPNQFDYRKYLSYHLISQQAYLNSNDWKLVSQTNSNSILNYASKLRTKLIAILEKKLDHEELGIASALILGYKNNIDAELKSAYSNAGVMHVLAVSGLHVGLIYMIFNYMLKLLDRNKYGKLLKAVLLILVLWSYAIITGLSPSVMRAATMFSFITVAQSLKRTPNFFNTLSASALLLLIIQPNLVMDVGFQLSYCAVIGIVLMQPFIKNLISSRYYLINKIWEITSVSIAAQIATFPLGLFYFHQFPNYFLVANLVVIPLAVIILYLGISSLLLSTIPYISDVFFVLLSKSIWALNKCITIIDSWVYAITENIRFEITDVILTYLIIAFTICLVAYRKFKWLLLSSVCSILFLVNLTISELSINKQKLITIYNIPSSTAINFIDGEDNILVSDLKLRNNRSKMLFHVKNNWINKGVENEKIVDLEKLKRKHLLSNIYKIDNKNLFTKRNYFQYYNTTIAIIDDQFKLPTDNVNITVDLLIWSKNAKLKLKEVLSQISCKQLIIDSSNSTFTTNKIQKIASEMNIEFWSVNEQGAFIYKL